MNDLLSPSDHICSYSAWSISCLWYNRPYHSVPTPWTCFWHTWYCTPLVLFLPHKQNSNCNCKQLQLCHSDHQLWSPTGIRPRTCCFHSVSLSDVMHSHFVLHHFLADDTQLQKSAPPQQVDELIQSMQKYIHDIESWMIHNKLKLNEALIISASRISNYIPLPDFLTVWNSTVCFSQSAKYLGVKLDMHLTMTAHVVKMIRTADFELCRINSIWHYLSVQVTKTLFSAFVFSWLDYFNSLLSGLALM